MEEKRKVQIIAPMYYSRLDVQNAIYHFCKHRETVPRYLEGFGKRPDVLDYPSDVFALVKKGATSFHCSEEIWENPLEIKTEMTAEQYNQIKIGWDFLIDIDSKYLDYSKIAADLIIKALEFNGVKNIGVKFSGSKGFHILIPSEAFPEELNGEKTKDKFPEWPRLIAGYVDEMIHDKLVQEIFKMSNHEELESKGKALYEVICTETGEQAIEKKISKYVCRNCRSHMESTTKSSRKTLKCPSCGYDMDLISSDSFYICQTTKANSKLNPEKFERRATAKELIDSVDIVLVASRHLFRAPYSLHEKTALVSAVVDKDKIREFNPFDADPLKIQIKDFKPKSEPNEAKELLVQALDWAKRKNKIEKKFEGASLDLKGLTISEDMFPEVIKKIMAGLKEDGRKRALSVLVSFFTSLDFPQEYIEEKLDDWNKKNYKPLKEGYIRSQIAWGMKHKRLPPNYDKSIYKELGVLSETQGLKNPINYTIREALRAKGRKDRGKKD
jgi:DNA primase catalytic subunit